LFARAAVLDEREVLYHVYANLNGDNWDEKWNTDDTDVCAYHGIECNDAGKIIKIDLKDNNLAGSVSPHVYTLPHLRELDLSKNRITSAGFDRINVVIEEEDEIADVEVIELTNNLVSSVEGVSRLAKSLTGLHMTFNNLKGAMPAELFRLPLLEILAVSENELTGTIDKHLGNLTNLLEFYCYGNKLTGTIPSEIGKLTKMQIITVSNRAYYHSTRHSHLLS
jgi:Leucine-rich repeat (LRR) protein